MGRADAEDEVPREYITLIVRLLVTAGGELVQGEVTSLDQVTLGHFRDWDGAVNIIRRWLFRRQSRG